MEKDSEIARLNAKVYSDESDIAMYKYFDGELLADYFDKNGNVNLDQVYASAKDSIKKSGQFELFGIIFNETDIDKLYSAIQRG